MDCRTAEGMVSSYIKHDLPLNELEEFLDHDRIVRIEDGKIVE